MTETQTKQATIPELKQAAREAARHERQLAQEVDALPDRIQEAARKDARRQARAARESGTGAAVAEVAQESQIPAMRQREAELPFLRWSAGIRTASLELSLAEATIRESERKAKDLKVGLEGLKLDADEATRRYEKRLAAVRKAESGASMTSYARHTAKQRLRELEQEYPDA